MEKETKSIKKFYFQPFKWGFVNSGGEKVKHMRAIHSILVSSTVNRRTKRCRGNVEAQKWDDLSGSVRSLNILCGAPWLWLKSGHHELERTAKVWSHHVLHYPELCAATAVPRLQQGANICTQPMCKRSMDPGYAVWFPAYAKTLPAPICPAALPYADRRVDNTSTCCGQCISLLCGHSDVHLLTAVILHAVPPRCTMAGGHCILDVPELFRG